MGWQEVGVGTYLSFKDREPGDIVLEGGWFLRPIKGNFEKPNYEFMQQDGSKVILNGCGYVHKAMEDIVPGDFCRVIYGGQGMTSEKHFAKNRPQHIVKILIDPDQRGTVRDGVWLGYAPKEAAAPQAAPISQSAAPAPQPAAAAPEPDPAPADDGLDW